MGRDRDSSWHLNLQGWCLLRSYHGQSTGHDIKPLKKHQWKFECFWLYGAVSSAKEKKFFLGVFGSDGARSWFVLASEFTGVMSLKIVSRSIDRTWYEPAFLSLNSSIILLHLCHEWWAKINGERIRLCCEWGKIITENRLVSTTLHVTLTAPSSYFDGIPAPRVDRTKQHLLKDLLVITVVPAQERIKMLKPNSKKSRHLEL